MSTESKLKTKVTNIDRPPLKPGSMFGGIAGVLIAEQGDPTDSGHLPSMSHKARETGKLQDMYRRTLAASWAAQAGELPADQCIEDIFAGGDGWGRQEQGDQTPSLRPSDDSTEDRDSEGDRTTVRRPDNRSSEYGSRLGTKPRHTSSDSKDHSTGASGVGGVSGRSSIQQQVTSSGSKPALNGFKRPHEIDEFTAREDLRSWEISSGGRA